MTVPIITSHQRCKSSCVRHAHPQIQIPFQFSAVLGNTDYLPWRLEAPAFSLWPFSDSNPDAVVSSWGNNFVISASPESSLVKATSITTAAPQWEFKGGVLFSAPCLRMEVFHHHHIKAALVWHCELDKVEWLYSHTQFSSALMAESHTTKPTLCSASGYKSLLPQCV